MGRNPYTLTFGKIPKQIISRSTQTMEVLENFCDEEPSQQVYVITGIRGSGKTVFMTEIAKQIQKRGDWTVFELNPEKDLLNRLAAKLNSEDAFVSIFKNAKINLSFFGLGIEMGDTTSVKDLETALSKMLASLKKNGKRVLITIDEVTNTKTMREFAAAFQIFVRQELPVFLLMTGLYENINELQNEKSLTFLYRAPKIELKPLNIMTIAENYRKNFAVTESYALKMAKFTNGYSFAFQVLGYFAWEKKPDLDEIKNDVAQYLQDYVYTKIWSELSMKDRQVIWGIARTESGKVSEIRELLQMESNEFTPYRRRLIRRGVIVADGWGYVRFALPLFDEFALINAEE